MLCYFYVSEHADSNESNFIFSTLSRLFLQIRKKGPFWSSDVFSVQKWGQIGIFAMLCYFYVSAHVDSNKSNVIFSIH